MKLITAEPLSGTAHALELAEHVGLSREQRLELQRLGDARRSLPRRCAAPRPSKASTACLTWKRTGVYAAQSDGPHRPRH
jgi:hypothetical protein